MLVVPLVAADAEVGKILLAGMDCPIFEAMAGELEMPVTEVNSKPNEESVDINVVKADKIVDSVCKI